MLTNKGDKYANNANGTTHRRAASMAIAVSGGFSKQALAKPTGADLTSGYVCTAQTTQVGTYSFLGLTSIPSPLGLVMVQRIKCGSVQSQRQLMLQRL